ncbi:MAG: DUF1499 domain-containing protein [Hyphomicrobiaceae bacterium]|nr:DUF1499 domain-containing protein [Hyphomicrobiaceae bacterium]
MQPVRVFSPELSRNAVRRMMDTALQRPEFSAVWSLRLALFSGALVIVAIALHRLLGLPTPVLLNVIKAGLAGAAAALLLGLAAAVRIWLTGRAGAGMAFVAMLASLALFAWPAIYLPALRSLPPINDVTTDPHAPPPLVALARLRGPGANPQAYPGETFAEMQAIAYPDLQPFLIARSADEAFELAADAVRRLNFQVVAETPPGDDLDRPGLIEAVDRTPIIGFYDDVVIRIQGDEQSAQIDVRSASRYGRHDLGRNASRVRAIFQELRTRLESTVPAPIDPRAARSKQKSGKGAASKQPKGDDRGRAGRRSGGDRGR